MASRKDELKQDDKVPSFKEALKEAEHNKPEADQASPDQARTPGHHGRNRPMPGNDNGGSR